MCQLLLVDPSAWTRWTRNEEKTPPHIYRALEWFLALNEKTLTHPDLATIFQARYKAQARDTEFTDFQAQIITLEAQLLRQRVVSIGLSMVVTAVIIAMILRF